LWTRRTLWAAFGAATLAVFALLIPASPLYLWRLFPPRAQYLGHSAGYWMDRLDSPNGKSRLLAIHALGALGPDAGEAVPTLADIMVKDGSRRVRIEAALALMKMCPASRAAVPALAQALTDKEPLVRMDAAIALVRLGPEARPAVPALAQALRDGDNNTNAKKFLFTIQEMAAVALGPASAGTADGVPALREALAAADTDSMRIAAARALGAVGAEARPAAPQLRALLRSASVELRQTAADSLRQIGGGSAETNSTETDRSQAAHHAGDAS
jgi:HEAT repeat protein